MDDQHQCQILHADSTQELGHWSKWHKQSKIISFRKRFHRKYKLIRTSMPLKSHHTSAFSTEPRFEVCSWRAADVTSKWINKHWQKVKPRSLKSNKRKNKFIHFFFFPPTPAFDIMHVVRKKYIKYMGGKTEITWHRKRESMDKRSVFLPHDQVFVNFGHLEKNKNDEPFILNVVSKIDISKKVIRFCY